MARRIKVLFIEDSEDDVLLIVAELRRNTWDVAWERVETREGMSAALERSEFDLVVSDYRLPRFSAPEAVALHKERGLETPIIVVSGTVGEENAVEVLKAGAHDFFLKDRLARLSSAIGRELREAEGRRTLRLAERERKEAIEALRRSEELFHDLFESGPDATMIIDGQGWLRAANRQTERVFGYTREDLIGQHVGRLVLESMGSELVPVRVNLLEGPRPRLVMSGDSTLVGRRGDGSTFPVEISLSPLRTEAGAVVAAIRDVTERRQLEDRLHQSQRIEAVGRLAGGIAHDFNNLLGVILGQSQMALGGIGPDDASRARLEQILSASERAAGLTRQLLAFSRRQVFDVRVIDLNDVTRAAVRLLGRLVGEDIEVTFRPGEDLGRVRADPSQLEQILMNLAVNARDAMAQGGRLAIETFNADMDEEYARRHAGAGTGDYVCLIVSDTGHGMTKEVQARIFEPFFTTKEPGEGTGLGLPTVYGIVKQSGGFIYVYSEPGRGATFKIYLPRVEGAVEKAEELPPLGPGWETVLLAEDETGLRELIREMLEGNGYRVLVAADPLSAIDTAERHDGPIHLLLTDVVMPRMSGGELARQVRTRRRGIRVLFMSGYTDDAIARQGVLEPGSLLISKPFSQAALGRKLREALGPSSSTEKDRR